MSETLALSLPYHVYGVVDCRFVSGGERDGWIPAVWFGVTLPRNRALGLTVLLDNGAQYRELPSHAWAFTAEAPDWTLPEAQAWDCFGGAAQLVAYEYLDELPVQVLESGLRGSYLFTVEYARNGFSREPSQSKSLHAIRLDNGRLTWQPNDRLRWYDASFTDPAGDLSWLRRSSAVWGVEEWPGDPATGKDRL